MESDSWTGKIALFDICFNQGRLVGRTAWMRGETKILKRGWDKLGRWVPLKNGLDGLSPQKDPFPLQSQFIYFLQVVIQVICCLTLEDRDM